MPKIAQKLLSKKARPLLKRYLSLTDQGSYHKGKLSREMLRHIENE